MIRKEGIKVEKLKVEKSMSNFVIDCIKGDALTSEIYDYIDNWDDSDSDLLIHEYLGMTEPEYALFVEDEDYIDLIITAHKQKENIRVIVESQFALVARADNHLKASRLEMWLKNENLWD